MARSEIVLTTGDTITVEMEPAAVMDGLIAAQAFVPFEDNLGNSHWVRADHVIAVREAPEGSVQFG